MLAGAFRESEGTAVPDADMQALEKTLDFVRKNAIRLSRAPLQSATIKEEQARCRSVDPLFQLQVKLCDALGARPEQKKEKVKALYETYESISIRVLGGTRSFKPKGRDHAAQPNRKLTAR